MRGRRLVLLPLLGLAHVAVLAVSLAPGSSATAALPEAITVVAVAAPPLPGPVVVPTFDLAVASDVAPPAVEIAAIAAPGCAMGDTVQAAIAVDGPAREALAAVPAAARSVANVVTLWDGGWRAADWREPVRRAVAASIRTASAECRDAAVAGPRLLYVADVGGTLVLAVGSGSWKWSDLLA